MTMPYLKSFSSKVLYDGRDVLACSSEGLLMNVSTQMKSLLVCQSAYK